MYFKANTLQALEAESRRREGPTLNLSSHSSLVKYKLGLGWSTSFLVCKTGGILPTLWGFEEDCELTAPGRCSSSSGVGRTCYSDLLSEGRFS